MTSARRLRALVNEKDAHEVRAHGAIDGAPPASAVLSTSWSMAAESKVASDGAQTVRAIAAKEQWVMARALEREARAVAASKRAIENHQLALADAQLQALPLRMLLGVEGMAEPIRARVRKALAAWVREFERNQVVVALALWRLHCMQKRRVEQHDVYRKQGAASVLSELMKRLQLRLLRKVVKKYLVKIGWLLFNERVRGALTIQTGYRRMRDYKFFLMRHDAKPICGVYADIVLAPWRKLRFEISPRCLLYTSPSPRDRG